MLFAGQSRFITPSLVGDRVVLRDNKHVQKHGKSSCMDDFELLGHGDIAFAFGSILWDKKVPVLMILLFGNK